MDRRLERCDHRDTLLWRSLIASTPAEARASPQTAKQVAQDRLVVAGNRGRPTVDVNDTAIFETVLCNAGDLVIAIKSHRDHFAADFTRRKKGAAFGYTGNVIIAVPLHVGRCCGGRRSQHALYFTLRHAFGDLREGSGLGIIAPAVDFRRTACDETGNRSRRYDCKELPSFKLEYHESAAVSKLCVALHLPASGRKGKRMIFKSLLQRKPRPADLIYEKIVAAARRPHFYAELNVPDTVEGRFDMIALHMFAVLNRLKDEEPRAIAQDLVDVFFADMDRSLREMGAGDLTVGKKVRKIAENFYGRVDAYRAGLAAEGDALREAVARNVFAEADAAHAGTLAAWLRETVDVLKSQSADAMASGHVEFA